MFAGAVRGIWSSIIVLMVRGMLDLSSQGIENRSAGLYTNDWHHPRLSLPPQTEKETWCGIGMSTTSETLNRKPGNSENARYATDGSGRPFDMDQADLNLMPT
jgi:hypothetical protein